MKKVFDWFIWANDPVIIPRYLAWTLWIILIRSNIRFWFGY